MYTYDEQLVMAVSQQPVLYNPMRHDYKIAEAKFQAWTAVKQQLDTPESIERIRQRWKSIRDSYVKYLNKKDKSPSGENIRPYKYERYLKFLEPFLNIFHDHSQILPDADESLPIESVEQFVSVQQVLDDDQSSSSSISSKKRKREDRIFDNAMSLTAAQLNDDTKLFQHMDDVDIFFLGLAQTMKKLRPLTMAKLKKKIANLVSDAEICELQGMDQYVVTE